MRKIIALGIMLLFLGMTISSTTGIYLEKQTIKPKCMGNILYVGGNGPNNYTLIQDAINDASDGDTVFVYNGTYYENVIVNKSINLIGENKNSTIIDANALAFCIGLVTDCITVNGFTIQNSGSYYDDSGIVFNSSYLKIVGNIIKNNKNGIQSWYYSSNNIISENEITNNRVGISLYLSKDNTVFHNNIKNNYFCGLDLEHEGNNSVYLNNFEENRLAIVCYESEKNIFTHNNFLNNTEQAWDDNPDNQWDNDYPSGGNYWSDYNGIDEDGDGIGDTPYPIPGGDKEDRYPLMEPYGMTELSLNFRGGLFKYSGTIKNIGNNTAFNVQWKITIDGGLVILGKESSGTIPKPLLVGEETKVSSNFVLGFGKIMITVAAWADNAPLVSKSTPGFLFLFFIQINPGGGI